MGLNEIDYLTGPGIEGRHEVAVVKRELGKIGIFLEGFGITITGVYIKPRPFGFDFDCKKPQALLALALFGYWGDSGQVGPMVRPMEGVDGKMRWVIGLTGHW